ncbi:unnamed protein product [Dovyalis caffra]|uniref:Ubiquitin-like protease family profile domain-containing protein n=1 Tax=Dovyalis caffra TaxID=77055 RepID=A0AAV1RPU2_9ROSI|nr:unnamed protein product [Dovyalis caffra]
MDGSNFAGRNKRLNVRDTSLINLLRIPPTYIPIEKENQYYVDDSVINAFFELLRKRAEQFPNSYIKNYSLPTWMISFLLSGKWSETKALSFLKIEEIAGSLKLFVPVCLKDHWILICVDIEKQALLCRVDCGIFVMKYADCLVHGNHFPFNQENMPHFRQQVFLDIYRGRLPNAVSILGFRKVDQDGWEKHLLWTTSEHANQQPQQPRGQNSSVEVGKFGLEEEVERLQRDKNVLTAELVKLRQQQQSKDSQVQTMVQRLEGAEQRQQQMMSFLAKAMQSRDLPNFVS